MEEYLKHKRVLNKPTQMEYNLRHFAMILFYKVNGVDTQRGLWFLRKHNETLPGGFAFSDLTFNFLVSPKARLGILSGSPFVAALLSEAKKVFLEEGALR